METEIQLYRGEHLDFFGCVPLAAVLRTVFRPILQAQTEAAGFLLWLRPIVDTTPIDGAPRLVNLRSVLGYCDVVVVVDGAVLYRHPHRVSELLAPALQEIVAQLDPEVDEWGFCVSGPEVDDYPLERPAPLVEGAVDLDLGQPRRLRFLMQKLEEPAPEIIRTKEVGIDPASLGPINVLVCGDVVASLGGTLPFSMEVEEGGFLSGRVRRADGPEVQYIVEVSGVSPAKHSGASLMHFTFTGDSFGAMNQILSSERPGEQLLGWYHTHLFPATDEMGLSSIDVDLHFETFRLPWQVAGLVNVADGKRVLRFYARHGDEMRECPQWVVDERGRYSAQRTRVGTS
jgi:hypothetical protein